MTTHTTSTTTVRPLHRRIRIAAAVAVFALWAPSGSEAGEIGAFLSMPTPRDAWKTGFGFHAAIISLPFVQAGGEFARATAEGSTVVIETYTAQAELSPPALKVKPFVGLGVGAHRFKNNGANDWGTVNALFLGLKIPAGGANLRAEFRKMSLSGTPEPNIDKRFSLGISLSF